MSFPRRGLALLILALNGCDDEASLEWTLIGEHRAAALTSVWGTSPSDVWVVGADAGAGPTVLRWDGARWNELATGTRGDLWWVFGFAGGPVFLGGADGTILRWHDGAFTAQQTPAQATVFGLWGAGPDDMWAVGGSAGGSSGAFAWRLAGEAWVPAEGFPASELENKALWKVAGSGRDDVWLVGTSGVAVHWDGATFAVDNLGGGESLFTVARAGERFVAVGGFATGLVWEHGDEGWRRADGGDLPALLGVTLAGDEGWAVGTFGAFVERRGGAWRAGEAAPTSAALHAVWSDGDGVWAVGGQLQTRPLRDGVLAYRGPRPPRRLP